MSDPACTVNYSIMPAHGGAYGWMSRDSVNTLGPNHADTNGWDGDHPISGELHQAFAAWQLEYETADFLPDTGCLQLDWNSYHERGLQLTRRLKTELGESARVFYVKPSGDPEDSLQPRVEVMLDGSVKIQPSFVEMCRGRQWRRPRTVISGGQTGVDRAALDWAIKHGIAHGGWCPKGRVAGDGILPACYQLQETKSAGYRQRTKLNVRDSDVTLIFNTGELDGGTLQTTRFAQQMKKPWLLVQLGQGTAKDIVQTIAEWRGMHPAERVNMAGPREEKRPGIGLLVTQVLELWFDQRPSPTAG